MVENFRQRIWQARQKGYRRGAILFLLKLLDIWRQGGLPRSARALVYMTLLTLVPLLAVAFALLRGFGLENVIEPWLQNALAPMGDAGAQVVDFLIRFVSQAKAGSLGIIGVVFLFVSVVNLAHELEQVLNRIWDVDDERPFALRIAVYLSAVMLTPLLLGALMSTVLGMGQSAWMQSYAHLPWLTALYGFFTGVFPVLLLVCVLTGLYYGMPNCRVRWWAAACGAIFFVALWFPVSWLFRTFIAGSAGYSAIYSSFVSVVILLLWLNFLWLIFLFGAQTAMLVQRPQALAPDAESAFCHDDTFVVAVAVMTAVFAGFYRGEVPLTADDLVKKTRSTPRKIRTVLDKLTAARMLRKTQGAQACYLPVKSVRHYTFRDIYRAVGAESPMVRIAEDSRYPEIHARFLQMLDEALLDEQKMAQRHTEDDAPPTSTEDDGEFSRSAP